MKILLLSVGLLASGCTNLSVEEQARQIKVCRDAGLGVQVLSNEFSTYVVGIHCTPPVEKKP